MIGVIGISFKTVALSVRGKYSFTPDDIREFTKLLQIDTAFNGCVIISTCNRTEIYYSIEKPAGKSAEFIVRNLAYFKKLPVEDRQYFYTKQLSEAVEHLFKVVSGLDSMVLGEDQVIGQVKDAFKFALEIQATDSILTRLFNKAFEAGKRVRTQTAINQGNASVSSTAAEICHSYLGDFKDKKLLVLGAGQTGELSLAIFTKKGIREFYVTNRTHSKAQALANKYKGKAFYMSELDDYLKLADIVVVATSSTSPVIYKLKVEKALHHRDKEQVYIDLSVPRNIDEAVDKMEKVKLWAVDDMKEKIQETSEKREAEVEHAMEIIHQVKQEFSDWLCSLELIPTITRIKKNFKSVHQNELENYIKVHAISQEKEVSGYGQHITDKYARLFIKNLKEVTDNGKRKEYVEIVKKLFELS